MHIEQLFIYIIHFFRHITFVRLKFKDTKIHGNRSKRGNSRDHCDVTSE